MFIIPHSFPSRFIAVIDRCEGIDTVSLIFLGLILHGYLCWSLHAVVAHYSPARRITLISAPREGNLSSSGTWWKIQCWKISEQSGFFMLVWQARRHVVLQSYQACKTLQDFCQGRWVYAAHMPWRKDSKERNALQAELDVKWSKDGYKDVRLVLMLSRATKKVHQIMSTSLLVTMTIED